MIKINQIIAIYFHLIIEVKNLVFFFLVKIMKSNYISLDFF